MIPLQNFYAFHGCSWTLFIVMLHQNLLYCSCGSDEEGEKFEHYNCTYNTGGYNEIWSNDNL